MSVTVFDGQLARTWKHKSQNRTHVICLYHDTITGVRSAMLNYEEIYGSSGNTSILIEGAHQIQFTIGPGVTGCISIKKNGMFGFNYECSVNGIPQIESMQEEVTSYEETFKAEVIDTFTTPDEDSGSQVAWYIIEVTRLKDNVHTRIHRRFRDFADMNSQVKQNLKGHILLSSVPALPEKTLKILVDHNDPTFIRDRVEGLSNFLRLLVNLPQVCEMTCVKGFLGIMEQVREFSIEFSVQTLGFSLVSPVSVDAIQRPELCVGVLPGDSISKINGVPVSTVGFSALVNRLKYLPRPMIVHFVRILNAPVAMEENTGKSGTEERTLPAFVEGDSI